MCLTLYFALAEATDEAERIRSRYHIALNNPTTVLQQEQAKEFFANHDPVKLYQLIIEGTQVSDALEQYNKASLDVKVTQVHRDIAGTLEQR